MLRELQLEEERKQEKPNGKDVGNHNGVMHLLNRLFVLRVAYHRSLIVVAASASLFFLGYVSSSLCYTTTPLRSV